MERDDLTGPAPWEALWHWAEDSQSTEGQELTLSLVLEPHGALVDDLADTMGTDEIASFRIDGAMKLGALEDLIATQFGWVRMTM